MISSGVLKLVQICGLVFKRSTMILFTLPYPLFIFCYCLSSMFYIKRIIHRGFHIVWSLKHTICQLYWASEFSSSRNISLCLVPDTLLRQEVPAPVWCHHFISSVCLRIGFLQSLFQTKLSCSRTHLHIAVVHDTVYNVCIISCRVLKIIQISDLVFCSSTMILFTLPYPLFIFGYGSSSVFYVKRINHRGFYMVWSLAQKLFQFYWPSEFSSSINISLCLVPGTFTEMEHCWACVKSSFHFK